MRMRVFAAGLLNVDERGRLFIRHREKPYEDPDRLAEVAPWPRWVRTASQYIEVQDPHGIAEVVPAWVGIHGTVSSAATEGREPPIIEIDRLVDYPSVNRDSWDELVAVDSEYLIVEGTPDFIRPGPSKVVSGKFPFEPSDFDAAEASGEAVEAEPLWNGLFSIGAGFVEGKGLSRHLGFPIVTDPMRDWLIRSPHLIYVRPVVQRSANPLRDSPPDHGLFSKQPDYSHNTSTPCPAPRKVDHDSNEHLSDQQTRILRGGPAR